MKNVFISDIEYIAMPDRERKTPRQRFIQYYEDLYRSYGKTLSPETFGQGGQYTFAELGEALLDQKSDWTENVDLLLPTYWAYEFDPDYSSCGPYFQEKYGLQGQLFDVCEQGTLASLTGLHIMQKYLSNGSQYHKGILLALEQTTIPRNLADRDLIPQRNAACGIVLQDSSPNNNVLQLHDVLYHKISSGHAEMILNVINSLPQSISKTVLLKKSSNFWKSIKYRTNLPYKLEFIEPDISMLSLFESLHLLFHQQEYQPGFYCLIEEDIESFQTGILIVEKAALCN